jgi:hypothetical protein
MSIDVESFSLVKQVEQMFPGGWLMALFCNSYQSLNIFSGVAKGQ